MSRPGVQGNDVTGDVAGPTSVILSLGSDGPGSCRSGDASGWFESDGRHHGLDRRRRLPLISQIMAVDSGPIPP